MALTKADNVWLIGTAADLTRELRPGGWVDGHSPAFARLLSLPKTDLIADLAKEDLQARFVFKVKQGGSGRYDRGRRRVVVWLGNPMVAPYASPYGAHDL